MITIDPEFSSLIPPLSPDELNALDASLQAEGCRDALSTWRGILIDGHNRYALCLSHNISFQTIEREFENREDVMLWMISNQLARRNISTFARAELATRMKTVIAARAKANQGMRTDISQNSVKSIDTQKEVAAIAETSHDTIYKVEIITESAPPEVKAAARKGDLSINRAYKLTRALEKSPDEYKDRILQLCEENDEKIHILNRLYKSQGSPETNGTFEEIVTNGGFHAGKEMSKWLDFTGASVQNIQKALIEVGEHHKQIAKDVKQQVKVAAKIIEDKPRQGYKLLCGDLLDAGAVIEDSSVDYIITDPPYKKEFLPTYERLAILAQRVLKPGGSLLCMIGQSYLPEITAMLSAQLRYQWIIAYMTPGQSTKVWDRRSMPFWKPVLWYVKNGYKGDWHGDVIKSDANDKRFHEWGQSESGMAELVERFTYPGDTILDPFLGGGTTGVVAVTMKRFFIGIDINPDFVVQSEARIDAMLYDTTN